MLYIAVSFAVLTLASPAELAASDAPLAAAIQMAWPGAENVLGAVALFATANTVLITVIASSRVAFSMARDKEISAVFARVLRVRKTPWAAAILTFVMAAVLVPIGPARDRQTAGSACSGNRVDVMPATLQSSRARIVQ